MPRIIVAGCSYSTPEGGLPTSWPELVQERTEHTVINLSMPGGSNDRIYRVIHELHERDPITGDDTLIIQHTSQNRFEITVNENNRTGRDVEHRDYGAHIHWKVNSWRGCDEQPLRQFRRLWEEHYTNNEYNQLYYRRRHREFMSYARSNRWCVYHMWASQYSRYMRRTETYDNVIDVSTVTENPEYRLAPGDDGHLNVEGHQIVAKHVATVLGL